MELRGKIAYGERSHNVEILTPRIDCATYLYSFADQNFDAEIANRARDFLGIVENMDLWTEKHGIQIDQRLFNFVESEALPLVFILTPLKVVK